jgi:hypothetical protein
MFANKEKITMRHKHSFHSFVLCALIVIVLGAAQTVLAQTTVFTYQGKLDFDGVPANGQFDFQFKLFDATSGGTQQGATLEQLSVNVTNGDYKVNLDFGASVFTGADRFLEVSYRFSGSTTYTTLPRQQFTSTPYAIRSLVSTSADGLSAGCASCVTSGQIQSVQGGQVSGAIPVASVPAGSASYIQNTTSQQPGSNFNISGDGTAAGTLSANVVNATTQYNLGGQRVLSVGADSVSVGINTGRASNSNLFFGVSAGQNNSSGVVNAFFGLNAGQSNTTGSVNAFFGAGTGQSNTTGSYNAFFGASAGRSHQSGINNSFFGNAAGSKLISGQSNSFFGASAGSNVTSGFNNAFFGAGAGGGTTSNSNAFFGTLAGSHNTTGEFNTFIGAEADFANTNSPGSFNTLLGFGATVEPSVSYSTAIGYNARVTANSTVVLGTTSETVIVPGKLQVDTLRSASNFLVLGTTSETVIVPGKLQVDTLGNAGNQHLCLNNSNRLAPCSSSLRYKTDLRPFAAGLAIINRLQPVSFTWKEGGMRDLGFGAEDVQKIEPLLVTYNSQGQVEGVKYDRVAVVLVNAIKELHQQLAAQQTQIEELRLIKAKSAELEAQLAAITERLAQLEKAKAGRQ